MRALLVLLCVVGSFAPAMEARANPIERACVQSPRGAADPAMCGCIGSAARRTLTAGQMRIGARFFDDPDRAQEIRQSDRRQHEVMWQAWRNFTEVAERMCSRG